MMICHKHGVDELLCPCPLPQPIGHNNEISGYVVFVLIVIGLMATYTTAFIHWGT